MANSTEEGVFKTLNADDIDHTVTEIESCCMNCYENVSSPSSVLDFTPNIFHYPLSLIHVSSIAGYHPIVAHPNSLLQRDNYCIICM